MGNPHGSPVRLPRLSFQSYRLSLSADVHHCFLTFLASSLLQPNVVLHSLQMPNGEAKNNLSKMKSFLSCVLYVCTFGWLLRRYIRAQPQEGTSAGQPAELCHTPCAVNLGSAHICTQLCVVHVMASVSIHSKQNIRKPRMY